jgi:hypothetical protein
MKKVSLDAYRKLINDDAKWIVENTKDSLERRHILKILWDSIECYYPNASQYPVQRHSY